MSDDFGRAVPASWRRFSAGCAAGVGLIGTAALVGWVTGLRQLASIAPGYIPMAPNTAAGLLLLAACVGLRLEPQRTATVWLRRLLAVGVIAVTALTLLQHATGVPLAIDSLLFRAVGTFGAVPLGAMSPIAAGGLLLAALSQLADSEPARDLRMRLGVFGALLAGIVGFAVVLSYIYGTPLLVRSQTIPVALTTGIAFLFLSAGAVVATGPRSRIAAPFVGDGVHARMLRAFLPIVVGSVLLQAIFTNVTLNTATGNLAFFGAVTALMVIVVFGVVSSAVAGRIAGSIDAAESKALHSSERLAALVEQLPDFVIVHRGGTISFANPAAIRALGYDDARELRGRTFLELVHPDDREFVSTRLSELHDGTSAPGELRWVKTDGSSLVVEVTARQATFDDGPATLTVARDLSERRRLEEQLRQAVKMDAVGQLAGGVAHDFNNMLTVILSFARFVKEDLGEKHPSHPDIDEIVSAAQRAAALTRQLLTFSRKQLFEPELIDINESLEGIEKMLQRLIGEDISLQLVRGEELGQIRSDQSYLEQIILNLAVNARDAMPEGGKLTIETANVTLDAEYVRGHLGARPGPYVMIAVTDTGVGMDEATLARIFEPFFTTKGPGKGTGLGLSTVFGIVKQAGGDINVYSAPGRGTTFKVYLPRVDEAAAAKRGGVPSLASFSGRETVLLVEDEAQVRMVAERTLRTAGYQVLSAPSPEVALKLALEHPGTIDLVATDVVMPGMNGKDLAEQVVAARPGIRVLFLSGYTGGALVHQRIFESGIPYLQKPFTPELLAEKIRVTLDAGAAADSQRT